MVADRARGRRETFAYSCEAYAWILEHDRDARDRRALGEDYDRSHRVPDERVDGAEVADIVREVCAARNGWKRILARCGPVKK